MTKDVGILVLGLIVAAMPFLGFPSNIEQFILIVSGLLIAVLAFFIRGELGTGREKTESYVQNESLDNRTNEKVEREQDTVHGEEGTQKE